MNPLNRYARGGALAALGLYSVILLILVALGAGIEGARDVPVEGIDRVNLFHRLDQAVPVALAGLGHSLSRSH